MKPNTENKIGVARSASILFVLMAIVTLPNRGIAQQPLPPAGDCDAAIQKIAEPIEELITAAQTIGKVGMRIKHGEEAAHTPEEKKAALAADNAILESKKEQALKLKLEVLDIWDNFTTNLPCAGASTRSEIQKDLDDIQKTSERLGDEQDRFDRGTGTVLKSWLDDDRKEIEADKNDIKEFFTDCCAGKQASPNPPEILKRTEAFVGYVFLRTPDEPAKNLNGANGQVFYDFTKRIGIGADIGCAFGSDRIGATVDVTLHRCTYLFGPQIKSKLFFFGPIEHTRDKGLSEGGGMVLSFQPLFGVVHDTTRFQSSTISTSATSTAFMMSFGANLDVWLKKNFGIRPIDFAYQPTHFGGNWQNNWRFGAGVVFRFGKEK